MLGFWKNRVSMVVSKLPENMAFQKTPSYLYRKAPGSPFYLKLPIPPALRHHFPDAKGKPRTHVVEPLGTAKEAEAEQLKRPRLSHYWTEFDRLLRGASRAEAALQRERIQTLREALVDAREVDDEGTAELEVHGAIRAHVEAIEEREGKEAAKAAHGIAVQAKRLTLSEAVKEWNTGDDVRDSTRGKRAQTVRELLGFLRVSDCLPAFVTDPKAVAYVDWLNAGQLGHHRDHGRGERQRHHVARRIARHERQHRSVRRTVGRHPLQPLGAVLPTPRISRPARVDQQGFRDLASARRRSLRHV
jgi:hypothetical protein